MSQVTQLTVGAAPKFPSFWPTAACGRESSDVGARLECQLCHSLSGGRWAGLLASLDLSVSLCETSMQNHSYFSSPC